MVVSFEVFIAYGSNDRMNDSEQITEASDSAYFYERCIDAPIVVIHNETLRKCNAIARGRIGK